MDKNKNIVIGMSGASGAIYGVTLLKVLRELGISTHLVMSKASLITLKLEMGMEASEVQKLASKSYQVGDISACISSGSHRSMGMIIAPCSIRTMGEIAACATASLLTRAADVMLKERRPLVLMLRETPLHSGHLEQMLKLSQTGAIIAPPVPAFYQNPQTIEDIVQHSVGRVLDIFGLESPYLKRWEGIK